MRDPEHDRERAEQRNDAQQGHADVTAQRPCRECERDDRRADTGRGVEPSEPEGPDVQTFVGDGGQQRECAAEQHREEIERNRAEENRATANEPQSFECFVYAAAAIGGDEWPFGRFERGIEERFLGDRGVAVANFTGVAAFDCEDRDRGDGHEDRSRDERRGGRPEVEGAAENRTADQRDLPSCRELRGERRQVLGGHDVGGERPHRWSDEGAGDAGRHHDREDRSDVRVCRARVCRKGEHREGLESEGDRHDRAAIDAVGDGAGDEDEQCGRCELGEAEPTEVEFTAVDVEHEFAEGRERGLACDRRTQHACEQCDDRSHRATVEWGRGGHRAWHPSRWSLTTPTACIAA